MERGREGVERRKGGLPVRPPDRRPGPPNGHRVTLVTLRTFFPLWGCPGFCVERRLPHEIEAPKNKFELPTKRRRRKKRGKK